LTNDTAIPVRPAAAAHPLQKGAVRQPRRPKHQEPALLADALNVTVVVTTTDGAARSPAHAQPGAVVRGDTGIALGHRLLHRHRAPDGIDDAGKFHQ